MEDSQGHIYVHHTVHATSESHDTMVVFDAKGKFVRSWGKDFKGGAHGLHIRKEGSTEFLYLCDTKRGVVVKTTLNGEEVFTLGYPEQSERISRARTARGPSTAPPISRSRPTATSTSATATGPATSTNTTTRASTSGRSAARAKRPGKLDCPHGIIVDTRGKEPILTVADRSNNRIQRFTLDGKHIDFVGGTSMPCHFKFYKNGDCRDPGSGRAGDAARREQQGDRAPGRRPSQ